MPREKRIDSDDCTAEPRPTKQKDATAKRDYYYDDAHGYEDFDPEAADDDEPTELDK